MISVAMTTYNGEKYICEQIESILNQSLKVDEIIVCDDGSSDSTIELLKKYPVKVVQNDVNVGYYVVGIIFFCVTKTIFGCLIK